MQKERKKERKKENYCIDTQTSYTRAEREKGKERSKAQASDGRRARFLFSVVRRFFETE